MTRGVAGAWRRRVLALAAAGGLSLAGTAVLASPAHAAEVLPVTPVKIMPMGDSITNGVGATGGYRLELKELMVPEGHSFDYVGAVATGPFEIEDRQHEGRNGIKIDEVRALAHTQVTTYRPDVVLLMVGTNDITTDTGLSTAPDRLGSLLDTIFGAAPAASVIVASIPPLANAADEAEARTYNAALPGVVQSRADAGKKAYFVDVHAALSATDLMDGVHPNADGYLKIAKAWLPTLRTILPAPPAPSTDACPCSLWPATAAPTVPQVSSTSPTEVGVRFRVERYGQIRGIRFYKGPSNTGTHTGSLWTRAGARLATATFTNETASGWQQVNFATPVTVWPWTTYVASYFAPVGRYAADPNTFTTTEIVGSPVRMLASGQSGGNGLSVGTASGAFPATPSPQGANFWVDVVFTPVTPAPAPPPPSAPGGLRTTSVSSSSVSLAWNDVTGETGFRVERKLASASQWTAVGVAARDNWAFTDTGLAASTSYSYRVIATSRNGDSAPSATVTVKTLAPPPPATPTGVTAAAVSSSQVDVAWRDVSEESGYQVQRSADGSTGWAPVATLPQDVVSFSDSGLTASTTYYYRVVATNSSGSSAPSSVVDATTLAPPAVPPPTPTGVTAVGVSSSRIDVSWDDVAGESGYAVQRSATGSSGWTQVGTTGQDVVSFSDTGLAASTTYYYRVIATSPNGDSAPSSVVGAATFRPPPPATPGGVTATAISSAQIDVSWDDVAGESGYAVQRSATGSGGWTPVGTTGPDVTSFSDIGLAASTTYYYRMVATSDSGDSAPSTVVSATTQAPPPPLTPAGVTATAMSPSQVDVSWDDVAGESAYAVERSANGSGGWAPVGATGPDVTSFSDVGLAASTTYYYRVVATSGNGDSAPSAVVSATTFAPPPPGAPGGVSATAVSSSRIDVAWQDVAGESGYEVQRSLDGISDWAEIGTTAADVTSFSNTALAASGTYYYRVVATSGNGNSPPSAVVGATTLPPPAPDTPTGVTASAVSSSRIDVAWQDVAGESGYQVQRSLDGVSGWAEIATTGPDVTSFSDTGLTASTTYSYRVVATSPSGNSAPSAVAGATTLALPAPAAPTGVTATAVSSSRIDVAWQDVTGESGYQVQRSADGMSGWTTIGTTAQDLVSYSDTGLAPSTAYYYRVVATSGNGDSTPSAVVSATTSPAADSTPPTAPTALKASPAKRKVNLSWTGSTDAGSGVAGYRVYRSSSATGTYTLLATAPSTSVGVTAETGVSYWYRVTAYDVAGNESAPSAAVRAAAK